MDVKPNPTVAPQFYRPRRPQAAGAAAEKFLSEALDELEEVGEYAAESRLPPPAPDTVEMARRILRQVVRKVPLYYSVSPGEDGKIAIQAADERKNAVMILCNPSGGASCYVSVAGENRRAHYDSARNLPDSFVLEALQELERTNA